MNNVLLIEDDRALSNGILLALKDSSISITQYFTLNECRLDPKINSYDLIILDINLPDGNGLDLLKELRLNYNTKVILLTANDMEIDIITGLEMGADDYITKPFSLNILRARVHTQLRKQNLFKEPPYKQDNFSFDFANMKFLNRDSSIYFNKTEQKLLHLLIENKGNTLERNLLIDKIWSYGHQFVEDNALSVTIKRLRDKLEEDPSKPKYIKTVYGIGYTWTIGDKNEYI